MLTTVYIEPKGSGVVGGVLYQTEHRLAIDARAVLPEVGHFVRLPGQRALREVTEIRWSKLKSRTTIHVIVQRKKPPRRKGR